VGIELGQPGHTRTRHSAKLHEINTRKYRKNQFFKPEMTAAELERQLANEADLFNFKEFEAILKSKLQKQGFKPPIKRRDRVCIEENFMMVMEQNELSQGYQGDLQHFIKCYWEFIHRYRYADETVDLAKKILGKFNLLFIQGSRQNETSIELVEYNKLKHFMKNLVRVLLIEIPGDLDVRHD
jgi:hypothetical protein